MLALRASVVRQRQFAAELAPVEAPAATALDPLHRAALAIASKVLYRQERRGAVGTGHGKDVW